MKLLGSRIYNIMIHFDNLKNDILSKVQNVEYLSDNIKIILKNKGIVSYGCIIYCTISRIDYFINNNYSKWPAYISGYFNLTDSEKEELLLICDKANCLSDNKIDGKYNLNELSDEDFKTLLEINENVITKYFQLLVEHNNQFILDNDKFMNNMMQLGNSHNINEKTLVDFCNDALKRNINVINVSTYEELEKIYMDIYPEA